MRREQGDRGELRIVGMAQLNAGLALRRQEHFGGIGHSVTGVQHPPVLQHADIADMGLALALGGQPDLLDLATGNVDPEQRVVEYVLGGDQQRS